jgi:DNA-binding transcriptional ArsR family regulator
VQVFEVLAEPRRRQILDLLGERELPVGDLVAALATSQPNISKHLRVLRDAGLVSSRVDGARRLYRVEAAPLRELDEWVSRYRGLWTHALDQLEAHLAHTNPAHTNPADESNPQGGRRGRSARTTRR